MKSLEVLLKTGVAIIVVISQHFGVVTAGTTVCDSEKCSYDNGHNALSILSSNAVENGHAIITHDVRNDISEEISESVPKSDTPEVRILFDSDPLLATLSARFRAAFLNLQMKLWQYSDETVLFILVVVTSIFVVTAAVFAFLFGPAITAIVSLVFPFGVLGALAFSILLQPTSQTQAAILGGFQPILYYADKGKMLRPIKCSYHHGRDVVLACPTKKCVIAITVVILGILPLMTTIFALESIKSPKFSLVQMNRDYYLPDDTVTESRQLPRLFSVTKSSSTSGTTSTVRPWPSHSFFRSVLSKSDNVVVKNKSGSKSTREAQESGMLTQMHNSTLPVKGHQTHLNEKIPLNNDGHRKHSAKKYRVNRNRQNKGMEEHVASINSSSNVALNESELERLDTRARSEIAVHNAKSETERQFSSVSGEAEQQAETKLESLSTESAENSTDQIAENATKPSQPENFTATGIIERKADEYSLINSPQVGFQYEIVVSPPSSHSPKPTSSELHVKTTLNHMTASTAISPVLQHFPHNDSSGSNNSDNSNGYKDSSGNSRNTSNSTISTVNVNDTGEKVTNDDTTSTLSPPLLLESQVEEVVENAETAVATSMPSPLSSSSNKSIETILQNPQYPPSLSPSPPTQPLQLDIHLEEENSNGESITYNNKSHLPSSVEAHLENVSEPHKEIKKSDLWTINHNSASADSANKASLLETTTFLPLLKGNKRRQNSSSVNILTSLGSDSSTTVYPTFPTYVLKTQPTHFSFHPTLHSTTERIQTDDTSSTDYMKGTNQTFQKRIWQRRDHRPKETNSANTNYANIQRQEFETKKETALLNRRNMFTVVKAELTNPRIHIESRNATIITTRAPGLKKKSSTMKSRFPGDYPTDTLLYDRTNQVERPSVTAGILTGPDRMMVSASPGYYAEKDNDYFDEDDTQAKLHHWIESEQGHFVTPSTELPRFTNLTWPYYIPNAAGSDTIKNSPGIPDKSVGSDGNAAGSPATALAVSFNSERKDKPDFNAQFEFYIPSAAADPHQNPILLAKKQTNKTSQATYESWTRVPTLEAVTTEFMGNGKQDGNYLKQSDHKSKIKHSHWGSKGLSSIKPQNSQKVKPPFLPQQTKVYESSHGNPKSTSSTFSPPLAFSKGSEAATFTVVSNKDQKYSFTSPSSSQVSSTWPFGGVDGVVGQSETASFVTSKTPTNIWYKPIINHFTASVPFNGTTSMFDNLNDQIFNNVHGVGGGSFVTTTMQPPSTRRKGYVGDDSDVDDTFSVNTNKRHKTIPGKFNNGRWNSTKPEKDNDDSKGPILFKVWNLVDGKLKLENQREIPAWALHGYLIPASGTILNLQQIPPAIQPLVTSAMSMNKVTQYQNASNDDALAYMWKQLPVHGSFTKPTISSVVMAQKSRATTVTPPTTTTKTPVSPDEPLFDYPSNKLKIASDKTGWLANTEEMHASSKQPISINYVLWNNPASIYGQSIILSTPAPQTLLSHLPTPVSYFPSSTITSVKNTPQQQSSVSSGMTTNPVGEASSNSYVTTTTPRTSSATNMDQEKLELLFQNYFQYFITTSTPATTTTTTTARPPVSLANKVTEVHGGEGDNDKAWKDLKKLILRLASTKSDKSDNKASATLDKNKTGDLDYLGNVAAIALIMSYLRNQYEQGSTAPLSTTPAPYGVTDDMTPPNKDQLWATVYPLFQHFLNNPNYTFIPPPPPPQSSNQQLLSESSSSLASMTPTSPSPIFFTEPQTITGSSSNYFTHNSEYNHYASYYPTITTSPSSSVSQHVSITEVPKHGATTEHSARSDEHFDDDTDDFYSDYETTTTTTTTTRKPKTRVHHKHRKKKHKGKRKKEPAKKGFFRSGLLKRISGPLFKMKKKHKKYWLDLKFEIDFIEILKKKMLFFLAYKYMPVAMVLAFGLTPIILSLVPLVYKFFWMKWKKPKYIKVPIPFPKPYPVPVYKPPPPPPPYYYGHHHHQQSHAPPDDHFHRPEIRYEDENDHHNDDVIHVDSPPPVIMDHHYAADTTGNDNSNEHPLNYAHKDPQLPERENGGDYPGTVNSFNYDYMKHSTPNTHAGNAFQQYPYNFQSNPDGEDQEVHVHLHDDESRHDPQFQQAPGVTFFPKAGYTSYTRKDLQPYPVTKGYEIGFDIGKTLAGITNKHDMEIFKILYETKKEKLNKLLDMWNLAKYGAAVASEAAVNAFHGHPTPSYKDTVNSGKKRKKRKRRRKRKKRKHSSDDGARTLIARKNNSTLH